MITGLLIANGFTGALALVFLGQALLRRLGWMPSAQAYFSPKGGCQDAIVRELKAARREILVQADLFTAEPVTAALVDAKKRGVNVTILLDRSHEAGRSADVQPLLDHGLAPLVDGAHAAHNRVLLIDEHTLITGSFSFTPQAETENAENLLVLKGHAELIRAYRQNFMAHKGHSKPAQKRADGEVIIPLKRAA